VTDLRRYAEASAALERDPSLHEAWARSPDRAVRRALMRSPALAADVAATIVGVRRTGMHTLGSNPVAPAVLLEGNPGAQRRRAAVDALLPGGLADVERDPNRLELVELRSPTVDLVLAHAAGLDERTAAALLERGVDPYVRSLLSPSSSSGRTP
jgi:hypothetical protein